MVTSLDDISIEADTDALTDALDTLREQFQALGAAFAENIMTVDEFAQAAAMLQAEAEQQGVQQRREQRETAAAQARNQRIARFGASPAYDIATASYLSRTDATAGPRQGRQTCVHGLYADTCPACDTLVTVPRRAMVLAGAVPA